ncbi:MAG: ribose 5-phosphate isomerase B [Eggerthellaceae bacterium]|nr:ribose 5-phosphate isomerase B [Eggerthellaceae bacterium]
MKIAFACDHGGFEQKAELVNYLESIGKSVLDFGIKKKENVDYPGLAKKVAEAVAKGTADLGILVCGTGIGMSLAANKVRGIRCANVTRPEFSELARQHNDANILSLSGRYVSADENKKIIKAFFESVHQGGRHSRRVEQIMDIERENQDVTQGN